DDGMVIDGAGSPAGMQGAEVDAHGDHRLAMALAVMALVAEGETRLSDAEAVSISYPDFWGCLERLTAKDGGS
ncbi:MAG: 3-phosphoshikimate 1-carboxyvinyltransferase, partial [Gemmatimonadaceae bacterium]